MTPKPKKPRRRWYEEPSHFGKAWALMGVVGTPRRGKTGPDRWAYIVASYAPSQKPGGNARLVKAARALAGSEENRAALDALERLGDRKAVRLFVAQLIIGPEPPRPTKEEIAERRTARIAELVRKRADHVRTKLAAAERRLAIAKRVLKKWRAKAAYYTAKEL